jgi:hypothetical protein
MPVFASQMSKTGTISRSTRRLRRPFPPTPNSEEAITYMDHSYGVRLNYQNPHSFPWCDSNTCILSELVPASWVASGNENSRNGWLQIFLIPCRRGTVAAGHAAEPRDREGVVSGYVTPEGRSAIDEVLATMDRSGQQIIALGLFHEHGASGTIILDSAGGKLSEKANLGLSALIDLMPPLISGRSFVSNKRIRRVA